ncbi:MAG: D-alanyl-D-alanine carboxypeptidase, partial [Lentisphaeria bacterium]|nr:D-alanyl-D-alanine carboxypeptidase [Lentisphaeria bacterium]
KSANDAAYQIAEVAGNGSVDNFIAQMNRRAASLQMPGTRFMNPHGLPNRDGSHSVSSAMGMVILGERLLEYPDLMEWVGTQRTFIGRPMVKGGKTELRNTNRLVVPRYPGVDGMKTGYTRAAGFCLTFSAVRDGRRLMGCVTGFPTAKERDIFARRLLDWGFLRAAEIAAGKTAPPSASAVTAPVQRKKR